MRELVALGYACDLELGASGDAVLEALLEALLDALFRFLLPQKLLLSLHFEQLEQLATFVVKALNLCVVIDDGVANDRVIRDVGGHLHLRGLKS